MRRIVPVSQSACLTVFWKSLSRVYRRTSRASRGRGRGASRDLIEGFTLISTEIGERKSQIILCQPLGLRQFGHLFPRVTQRGGALTEDAAAWKPFSLAVQLFSGNFPPPVP
jgi:hypothetical protein